MQVRKGRPKTTRPVMNNRNPTWQEDFDFILDDPVGNFANFCVLLLVARREPAWTYCARKCSPNSS